MMRGRGTSATVVALCVVALAGYGGLLASRAERAVGGADSSGYANTARLILSGHVVAPVRGLDALGLPDRLGPMLTPLAFVDGPRGRTMAPVYPPGFPLHVAAAAVVGGWQVGPFVVSPLAAVACVLLVFVLGRQLELSRLLALAGAAIFAACPVLIFQGLQTMSDVVAAAWSLAAMTLAIRARRGDGWAAAAGAAFGMAVLVRPAVALLALPLALALPRRARAVALLVAGGAPFAIFYLAWNHAAYGRAVATGYAPGLFALTNLPARLPLYARWIAQQLSPLLLAAWLAVAADRQVPRNDRALLIVWLGSFILFHACWGPSDLWVYTRYLLPALPAAIVALLLVGRDSARWLRGHLQRFDAGGWLGGVLVAVVIGVVAHAELTTTSRLRLLRYAEHVAQVPDGTRAATAAAGAGGRAVVVSMEHSGALLFYTDLAPLRWDFLGAGDFATVRAAAAARGHRVLALLGADEIDRARGVLSGDWLYRSRAGDAFLWELAPGADAACGLLAMPVREVPLPALTAQNPACNPYDGATWLACNEAIHRVCSEGDGGCWSSGVGAVEWGSDGLTTDVCLHTEPPLGVAASALAAFGDCPVEAALPASRRATCATATHRYCRSLGYESGYGPVGSPGPGRWSVVCLRPERATALQATWADLQAAHDLCSGRDALLATPAFCLGASYRLCVRRGHLAGYGPVDDPDGHTPTIVCVDDDDVGAPRALTR
jgi:hypothetical protein